MTHALTSNAPLVTTVGADGSTTPLTDSLRLIVLALGIREVAA